MCIISYYFLLVLSSLHLTLLLFLWVLVLILTSREFVCESSKTLWFTLRVTSNYRTLLLIFKSNGINGSNLALLFLIELVLVYLQSVYDKLPTLINHVHWRTILSMWHRKYTRSLLYSFFDLFILSYLCVQFVLVWFPAFQEVIQRPFDHVTVHLSDSGCFIGISKLQETPVQVPGREGHWEVKFDVVTSCKRGK